MADIVPYDPERHVKLGTSLPGRPGYGDGYPELPAASKGLRDYLAILRRQWWIFLGITLLVGGVAGYRAEQLPARYQARSTIRLADRRDVVVSDPTPQRAMMARDIDPIASQIQLLLSRAVAVTAVDLKGLRLQTGPGVPFPEEIDSVRIAADAVADSIALSFGSASVVATSGSSRTESAYGQPLTLDGITLTVEKPPKMSQLMLHVLSTDMAAGLAVGGLNATPRQKTEIVDLSYTANDPYQAERMVNAMSEGFVAYSTLNAQQQSTRRRVFLEDQLRLTQAQLNGATAAFTSYRSGQRVFSTKTQGSAQEAGLLDIDVKRSQMAAEKKTYETLLAQAKRGSREQTQSVLRVLISSPGMASNPVVARSFGQLTAAEQGRDSLLTAGDAPTNPDLISVNTRITAYTNQLLAAVTSQIQALDAQLGALDALRAAGQTKIAAAPAAEAEEGQLSQQVKSVQMVADQLQADLQKAKMAEAVAAGQVEIVDMANNPGYPMSNGVPRKIAMGIFLGLLLGAIVAILVDGMNTSIRKRTDIEQILQVPSLAVIPKFIGTNGNNARFALPARAGKGRSRSTRGRPNLVTLADMGSSGAEAYRTLRTNLMFSQSVQALRTLVVTSASPGEGKTTTVGNLGIAFAQQNLRVLLVDCDLRRSRLHSAFDLPRGPGLTELLLGQVDQDTAVKPTTVPGLYVLPAGTAPPNPSEMLGGEKMRATLQSLSEAFDIIILDTPPLLAASDGAILATLSDGVVVVLRAGATESEAAQQAMHQLNAVGARVVGAVLNDPDAKVSLYGTQYTYDYAPADK